MSDAPDDDPLPGHAITGVLTAVADLDVMKTMIVLLGAMVITLAEGDAEDHPGIAEVNSRIDAFAYMLKVVTS
jgi:hypothetical protein